MIDKPFVAISTVRRYKDIGSNGRHTYMCFDDMILNNNDLYSLMIELDKAGYEEIIPNALYLKEGSFITITHAHISGVNNCLGIEDKP